MTDKIKGHCLCGSVTFETVAPHSIDVCHCSMCRRWVGGPFVGADFRGGVTVTNDATLVWYDSSEWAKRGFCSTCGSSLFYRLKADEAFWAICAGTLDLPEGSALGKEIFVDEKPGYYALAGEHPRLTGAEFMASMQSAPDD
jgi:hypothetical protein